MPMTERMGEGLNLCSAIQSISGTGSYYGDAIKLDNTTGRRFLMIVNVGAIGSSATVDAELRWSATSSGTYVTITGTAIVQDVAGGKDHVIEVSTEQVMNFAAGARFMKPYIKTLVAATPISVVVLGANMAYPPATNSAANIGQVINGLS